MTATKVDFNHVRSRADFIRVLAHYDLEAKPESKPGQVKALCPFHEDTRPSLKVNIDRNIFHCFACGAKGNVLEFVRDMEYLGEDELRKAALTLAEICGIAPAPGGDITKRKPRAGTRRQAASAQPKTPPPADEPTLENSAFNSPLSFELKLENSDELAAWLTERGIDEATAKTFGLGLASARSKTMGGRLAIPLHNQSGQLIGYAGRYLGDAKSDDQPKYILPKGFKKELELFNGHRLPSEPEVVVLFESFLSELRHHEHLPCCTLLGRDISPMQGERLAALKATRLVVVFDGDEPGQTGAAAVASQLASASWVRIVSLPDGVKPHHLSWNELRPHLEAVWPRKRL